MPNCQRNEVFSIQKGNLLNFKLRRFDDRQELIKIFIKINEKHLKNWNKPHILEVLVLMSKVKK